MVLKTLLDLTKILRSRTHWHINIFWSLWWRMKSQFQLAIIIKLAIILFLCCVRGLDSPRRHVQWRLAQSNMFLSWLHLIHWPMDTMSLSLWLPGSMTEIAQYVGSATSACFWHQPMGSGLDQEWTFQFTYMRGAVLHKSLLLIWLGKSLL